MTGPRTNVADLRERAEKRMETILARIAAAHQYTDADHLGEYLMSLIFQRGYLAALRDVRTFTVETDSS